MASESKLRSSPFNRFYHALLQEFHKKALAKRMTVKNMNYLKQGLKELDENYPKDGDKPLSTAKIDSKALTMHIEFIIAFMGQYGFTPQFVEDEWNLIMKGIRNV